MEHTLGYALVNKRGSFLIDGRRALALWSPKIADALLFRSRIRACEEIIRRWPHTHQQQDFEVARIARCTVCDGGDVDECSRCEGTGREVRE